jgi:hypothetical protein
MIDPKEDDLSYFADWYLNSGDIKRIYTPFKNPLLFIEGVSGVVLYRKNNFQVELFICQPNTIIPEHTHPDVDSYELFLYGMKFTHSGEEVITNKQSEEEMEGMPSYAYETIRVKPNDPHGGVASKNGGSFLSIQKWLNDVEPTHVSSNWNGDTMGNNHKEQTKNNNGKKI